MPTLVHPARLARIRWRECTGCGRLFPAHPDQTLCEPCAGWSR